ncbi:MULTISPECIES: low molecular weight phosphatase family protein [Pacificibacter]|uniref:arsenate-mycothiol transferase ArsC n=1 Tax=Pacificibacter TaxID=1042323 RepID=UPI001C08989F|nr:MULTISPECIES: low molecular weight phosphatase family protein [Pacificibacter]MBU2935869.1 low molecular weight phosphatase family protein [Pacificibacter marinus]MDO6614364.1 low molecular weight phosphatase family protein [Pacificibacter sp. 1_MG-2023]
MPSSILFCCDHNALRSPMAEAMMKQLYGTDAYVQSAGVMNDLDIDGFAVYVCQEIGVELSRHKARSFQDLQEIGEHMSSYDLIIALSPASHHKALNLTKLFHIDVEYWPITDPTGSGENRETKLDAYRSTRDQIKTRMIERFGPPKHPTP